MSLSLSIYIYTYYSSTNIDIHKTHIMTYRNIYNSHSKAP